MRSHDRLTDHNISAYLDIWKQMMRFLAFAALRPVDATGAFNNLVKHEPDGMAAGDPGARTGGAAEHALLRTFRYCPEQISLLLRRHSRSIVLSRELAALQAVRLFFCGICCGGRTEICAPVIQSHVQMLFATEGEKKCVSDRIYNVLFLCTGNFRSFDHGRVYPAQG